MSWKDINLLYGDEIITHFIPADMNVRVLEAEGIVPDITDVQERFNKTIKKPVDSEPLDKMVKNRPRSPIMILVDDATRPNKHTKILLPMLLEKLFEYGTKREDIRFMITCGSHDPPSEDLLKNKIFGSEIYNAWRDNVIIHKQSENCKNIGTSLYGTPIELNNAILESGLVIAVTDSEYHYFAGVAGTVKSFFPGCAGKTTIARNHPQMFDPVYGFKPECRLGNTKNNPVIQDIIEMVEITKDLVPVFCLDAVMDSEDKIVIFNAGDVISLHKLVLEQLKPLRIIDVEEPADLVIVSTGALSINLYQAGKGFHAGWNAVVEGGDVLLVANCPTGVGSPNYHETMKEIENMDLDEAMKYSIKTKCSIDTFKIGNQKVIDLLRILKRCTIHMITEMEPDLLRTFRIKYVSHTGTIQESLRDWITKYREEKNRDPLIYVLHDAGNYINVKKR